MTSITTKVCGCCHLEKPIEDFSFKDKQRGTRQSRCKSCVRESSRRHYEDNKAAYLEKAARNGAVYRERNKEHVENLLAGLSCHQCGGHHRKVFYNETQDGTQSVHDAVYAGLSLEAVDAAIARSKVWCSPCMQNYCVSFALAARHTRSVGAEYVAKSTPTNAYHRKSRASSGAV